MKKSLSVLLLAFLSTAGCKKENSETFQAAPKSLAQAPAVIAPYTDYGTNPAVLPPGSIVMDPELVTAPSPAIIEPRTRNGAPLEQASSSAVTPAPTPHYGYDGENVNGAVNNAEPAVFVSPFAHP